jgi:hypothetical protein
LVLNAAGRSDLCRLSLLTGQAANNKSIQMLRPIQQAISLHQVFTQNSHSLNPSLTLRGYDFYPFKRTAKVAVIEIKLTLDFFWAMRQ